MPRAHHYRTREEIAEVVRRFEDFSYTPEEFVHAKHLTVAVVYFLNSNEHAAQERMRSGLRKFIKHHGRNGYHETITEFWLRIVEKVVRADTGGEIDLVAIVNKVLESSHDKDLIYQYYSRERLGSSEAKAMWVEPDLKPVA